MNDLPHPRVGIGIIITRGNDLLLVRRRHVHGDGTWSTPGGHLDFGESPETCAVREAREETSVEISEPRFVAITSDVFESESKHYITLWLTAAHVSGEARAAAADELSQVGWFDRSTLPTPLVPPLMRLLAGESLPPNAFRKPSEDA